MAIRKARDGCGVNGPLQQPHLSIPPSLHLRVDPTSRLDPAGPPAVLLSDCQTRRNECERGRERETDCVTDGAKLGQESWGSGHPALLQPGEFTVSLLLSTCKHPSRQSPSRRTPPSRLHWPVGVCFHTHGRTQVQWNIWDEQIIHLATH